MVKKTEKIIKKNLMDRIISFVSSYFFAIRKSTQNYMGRRPHRSFKLTKKRDYKRSFKIEGYFAFSSYVRKTLWKNKRLFIWAVIVYAIMTAVFVGIDSQNVYSTLTNTIDQAGTDIISGDPAGFSRAGLLFLSTITGGTSSNLSDVQQFFAAIIFLLTWLTSVWLLRNVLAGHKVKFRDGLYNASSPLVSTVLVALVLIVQLLPVAVAMIGYTAAQASGLLLGGVESMVFWIAAFLLASLSLYWVSATFIALVVVALPGMYPFDALRTAGDLVVGRRVRIILRMIWMALGLLLIWAVIVIPVIMLDTSIKSIWPAIDWLPVVPVTVLLMSSFTIVWVSSYVYLLYRRIVADDAAPA